MPCSPVPCGGPKARRGGLVCPEGPLCSVFQTPGGCPGPWASHGLSLSAPSLAPGAPRGHVLGAHLCPSGRLLQELRAQCQQGSGRPASPLGTGPAPQNLLRLGSGPGLWKGSTLSQGAPAGEQAEGHQVPAKCPESSPCPSLSRTIGSLSRETGRSRDAHGDS